VKTLVISSAKKVIHFISHPFEGRAHDFSMLKVEFPPHMDWFANFEVRLDLGFQGFKDDYRCLLLKIPNKKPKGGCLTEEQKAENKEFAKERIRVEHSLSGLKRFRILSDRLRMHDISQYHEIIGLCAGLWNHSLNCAND
jgi:hypothetical protein